jgi:short-subunit dehydrogenase
VNNAGISFTTPFESVPIADAKEVFEVNYWGTLEATQKFLPLIRQHKGRVVSVSSLMGIVAMPGSTIYSGTKWAMEAAMDSLRLEMQNFGVSVSVVEPGYIKTPIEEKGFQSKDLVSPEQYELYKSFWEKSLKGRCGNFSVIIVQGRVKNFENAPGPEITSEVIKDALVNPYPRTR